jgi:predicted permease
MLSELLADLRYRLRALWQRDALERELDLELRDHLEREAGKHIAAGLPAGEAMRRARIAFGSVESVKEQSRDTRGLALLHIVLQDLRYAARSLRRNPGFTVAVVLTLALGIGANAAMFSIVDRLLFRAPAFLANADRVHRVYLINDARGVPQVNNYTAYTSYLDLRKWTTSFDRMAAYSTRELPVRIGTDGREMPVAAVSATLFDFFDAKPVLGRFFTAQEDSVPLGSLVAVLGYGFWQAHYGGRTDVIGQTLEIATATYTIIGVAPQRFVGISDGAPPPVFIPITAYAGTFRAGTALSNYFTRYNWSWMEVIARRREGVSVEAATADLSQANAWSWNNRRSLEPTLTPPELAHPRAIAGPLQLERGPNRRAATRVAGWVTGVAVIVLLIACANVANLLLARAIRRRREVALRLALGVSRRRLVGQLLTESLLLAGCGALAGLLLAHWGGGLLTALFLPDGDSSAAVESRTFTFTLLIAGLCGTILGLVPVLQARKTNLVESLKAGVRDGGARRSRARTGLLLLQAALSVLLLVGAGLFVRSFRNVRTLRLGYDVDPVLYISLNTRGVKQTDDEAIALRQRVFETARGLPGVQSVALGLTVPFWDTWTEALFVSGIDSVGRLGSFTLQSVSPEYFATMGTRILRGRGLEREDRQHAPPVVVVSETMARTLWPGVEALGQCVKIGADSMPCTTVVGIAEDIKEGQLADDPGRHYYLPIEQYHPEAAVLFARVSGNADGQEEAVRKQLQPLMPGNSYLSVTAMRDIVGPEMQSWRMGATMFVAFGGLALVLAAIGLYSVIAYDVVQRTHELGIRIALGARIGDLVWLVVSDGLRVALIGGAAGAVASLLVGHWLAPLLFDESPRDPLVYVTVAVVLLGAVILASSIPALRATRVDPNQALRAE